MLQDLRSGSIFGDAAGLSGGLSAALYPRTGIARRADGKLTTEFTFLYTEQCGLRLVVCVARI